MDVESLLEGLNTSCRELSTACSNVCLNARSIAAEYEVKKLLADNESARAERLVKDLLQVRILVEAWVKSVRAASVPIQPDGTLDDGECHCQP